MKQKKDEKKLEFRQKFQIKLLDIQYSNETSKLATKSKNVTINLIKNK